MSAMVSSLQMRLSYFFLSASTLRANSSLYLFAALLVYFVLGSLLASAADPPCDWKYLVALSLPPVFMRRSCSHCHSETESQPMYSFSFAFTSIFLERLDIAQSDLRSRLVLLTKEMCTPRLRWFAEQSRQR